MPTSASQVFINGIQLDIDPATYDPYAARKRGSVHPLIDGTVVVQDRGVGQGDQRIRMTGKTFLQATINSLWALYNETGVTYTLTDWIGNSLTVMFTPGGESFKADIISGADGCYSFDFQLIVLP
jgi:hypothetical protein